MDIEQHREVFKKTCESTASSLSGIHYGHCIAACESDLLSKVNMIFMVVPFQVGLPLSRWTQSLHCMIQKVKKPYITKLRIVQLYEADFNTMLKHLLGKRLMSHSEENRINGHQLFGSRKVESTYDALVIVWVICDMARV